MDAATAESLVATAEDARATMRRGEDAAGIELFERHYGAMREALDWCRRRSRMRGPRPTR